MRFKVMDKVIIARAPADLRSELIIPYVKARARAEVYRIEGELYRVKMEFGGAEFFVSDEMLDPVTP